MKTTLLLICICISWYVNCQKYDGTIDFNSTNFTISNAITINSPDLDFSPCFYKNNDILFVSSRDKEKSMDLNVSEHFFSPFLAHVSDSNIISTAQKFEVNQLGKTHYGPFSYNIEHNKIYFSMNNLKNKKPIRNTKGDITLKIYEATVSDNQWISIKDLPFNNDNYSCTHPTINKSNDLLIFASNMPGGYGGYDLYASKFEKNKWSIPFNLGKNINTIGNEIFPFIDINGVLFFSSNKHNSIGGYDIFSSDIKELNVIRKLESPINSEYDDVSMVIRSDLKLALLTSNRPDGLGKDDIYIIKPLLNAKKDNNVIIRDRNSNHPIENAEVRIYKFDGNNFINSQGKSLYDIKINNESEGSMNMKFEIKSNNYGDPDSKTDSYGTSKYIFESGKKYVIYITQNDFEPRVFNFTPITKKNEIAVILLDKKSDGTTFKSKIVADNFNAPIEGCNIRLKNLNTNEVNNTLSDVNGKFSLPFNKENSYEIRITKDGYYDYAKKIDQDNFAKQIELKSKSNTNQKGKLDIGSILILNNINYDFGKHNIKSGAAKELDALAKLMKDDPTITIEMRSHTDSRGTAEFNKELSIKRAIEAKNYLIGKGISEARISTLGLGETLIRNKCIDGIDCTDREHIYNRRTEVLITQIDNPIQILYTSNGPELLK